MRPIFAENDLTLNPRRTLGKHGLTNGSTIQMLSAGKVEAKRARANIVEEVGMILTPPPLPTDPTSISDALKVSDIKFEGWLASLPLDKVEALVSAMELQPRSGNIQSMVNPYLRFVKEPCFLGNVYQRLFNFGMPPFQQGISGLECPHSNRGFRGLECLCCSESFCGWNVHIPIEDLAERVENVRRYLKAVFLTSYLKFAQIGGKEGCSDHQRLYHLARDKMIQKKTMSDAAM